MLLSESLIANKFVVHEGEEDEEGDNGGCYVS
jgi:hypothetical protein